MREFSHILTAVLILKVPLNRVSDMNYCQRYNSHSLQLLGGGEEVILVHLHFPQAAHQLKTLHRTLQHKTRYSHQSEDFNLCPQVCA